MERLKKNHLQKIKDLCLLHNVNKLYTFGSINTTKYNEESDIDFLVDFKKMDFGEYADNYFDLSEKLENLLKKPIDLITLKSLKNPYFIESVDKSKKLIYEKRTS
ncbi:MAG: nucleotidyltransferase family protein [Bacteroidota bacterium]